MKNRTRLTLVPSLASFVCVAGAAIAVPARPLYEPPLFPKIQIVQVDLRGTTWHGKLGTLDRVIVFMPNGTMEVSANKGKVVTKGTKSSWKLEGSNLYFELNNQYFEFKGKVIGDTIVGESWNKANSRWETKLLRDPHAK